MTASSIAAAARRRRWPLVLGAVLLLAAVVGAYVNWLWWPVYSGLMITLVAIGLLLVGGFVAIVPNGPFGGRTWGSSPWASGCCSGRTLGRAASR